MDGHALVLITCGDPGEARGIARHLVEAGLAAGAQIVPIESVYRWRGEVVEDQEWLTVVKTRRDRFEAINAMVEEMHSYEVPPVVMVVMDEASRPYLDWIDDSLTPAP
jgi:periplasmic divalent cation tolerance protein